MISLRHQYNFLLIYQLRFRARCEDRSARMKNSATSELKCVRGREIVRETETPLLKR